LPQPHDAFGLVHDRRRPVLPGLEDKTFKRAGALQDNRVVRDMFGVDGM